MIDLHCHLLPGLDDGPETWEETHDMCRALVADGVRAVVATPHMLTDLYHVTCEQVLQGVEDLRREVARLGMPLEIEPGADVFLTADICDLLREGRVMTVANAGKYIMLELPQDVLPKGLPDCLFELQVLGVSPIITHPERNFEVQNNPSALVPLVEAGSLTQVTAASVEGKFGASVRHCAEELILRRLAHLVASDAHSPTHRATGLSRARAIVEELLSPGEAAAMFEEVPSLVLRGERYEPPEIVGHRRRKKKWWSLRRG